MAVAHDAASESHTGTTGSASEAFFEWTHTPVGTPKGAMVVVFTTADEDDITSVIYGGTTMTRVSGGQAVEPGAEPGRVDLFFLGASVPTGAVTVRVNRTNNATVLYATCATVTAAANTETYGIVLLQGNQLLAEVSVDDGSPGTNSLRYGGVWSGLGSPPSGGGNTTDLSSIDFGVNGCRFSRETTAGQGARSVGFTSGASDDVAAVHWAVREASAGLTISSVTPATFDSGVTGIVIAGSGFGATQGSSTLTIGSQAQTVTAWGDTSITFTSARGSNSMGAASLKLTRG